jgi:O-antigen/teichoic acid export membrane protein
VIDRTEPGERAGELTTAFPRAGAHETARPPLWRRLRNALPEHVVPTSSALVGNFLITGGLGFFYWLIAAHYFATEAVGFAAALVSAMMFLSVFASAGLGTLIIREAPRYLGRELSMVGTGVVGAGAIGAVLGLLFAVVISQVSVSFRHLAFAQNAAAFAFGVGLTAAVLVLDQCLAGLLNGKVLVARGMTFSLVKLVAVLAAGVWFGHHSGMLIFLTWVLGDLVAVAVLLVAAVRRDVIRDWWPREWRLLRELIPHAVGHQLMNIGLLAPSWAMPIIVTLLLSAESNAAFYVASIITAPGLYIPSAMAFSLFAVAVQNPGRLAHQLQTTLALSFGAAAIAAIGVLLFGRLVLTLFGQAYVDEGNTALVVLTLGMFPLTIKVHFANIRRIQGHTLSGALVILAGSVLELLAGGIGALFDGVDGVALGVLIALTAEAGVMLPTVLRAVRSHPGGGQTAPNDGPGGDSAPSPNE